MKLISINVARPRLVLHNGETISTGIFKEPVYGPVTLRTLNLDGDRQADLAVHGGPFKAVYGYPSEHYVFWRKELPGTNLPWGMFGENSRRQASSKMTSTSAIASVLDRLSSSFASRGFLATNSP